MELLAVTLRKPNAGRECSPFGKYIYNYMN